MATREIVSSEADLERLFLRHTWSIHCLSPFATPLSLPPPPDRVTTASAADGALRPRTAGKKRGRNRSGDGIRGVPGNDDQREAAATAAAAAIAHSLTTAWRRHRRLERRRRRRNEAGGGGRRSREHDNVPETSPPRPPACYDDQADFVRLRWIDLSSPPLSSMPPHGTGTAAGSVTPAGRRRNDNDKNDNNDKKRRRRRYDPEQNPVDRKGQYHLLVEVVVQESVSAAALLCFPASEPAPPRRREDEGEDAATASSSSSSSSATAASVDDDDDEEEEESGRRCLDDHQGDGGRCRNVGIHRFAYCLCRGRLASIRFVWEWLEAMTGCIVGGGGGGRRNRVGGGGRGGGGAAANDRVQLDNNNWDDDDAHQYARSLFRPEPEELASAAARWAQAAWSRYRCEPHATSANASSSTTTATAVAAAPIAKTKTKPLVLTFRVPNEVVGKGLDTISVTIPPSAWMQLCGDIEKRRPDRRPRTASPSPPLPRQQRQEGRGRDNSYVTARKRGAIPSCTGLSSFVNEVVPRDDIRQKTKHEEEEEDDDQRLPILQAIQCYVRESFRLDIAAFPMVQVSCDAAMVGLDGRCRFQSVDLLPAVLAELERIAGCSSTGANARRARADAP